MSAPDQIEERAVGPHFSEQTFDFLEELEHRNNREWFEEHKPTYEIELKARMLALIEAVNVGLGEFAPHHLRPANKAMMRIYRDVRFSHDKTPYKTHLAAFWPRQGLEKTGGAGLFVQVSVQSVMVAGGAWGPASPQLRAIRDYLLENHGAMRSVLAEISSTGLADPLAGNPLVRAPKGFPTDHPAADLLANRSWALTNTLPGAAALGEDLADLVLERFRAFSPLVDLLNVPLATVTPLVREAAAGRRAARS